MQTAVLVLKQPMSCRHRSLWPDSWAQQGALHHLNIVFLPELSLINVAKLSAHTLIMAQRLTGTSFSSYQTLLPATGLPKPDLREVRTGKNRDGSVSNCVQDKGQQDHWETEAEMKIWSIVPPHDETSYSQSLMRANCC